MNVQLVAFAFGCLLMMVAIVGGGFEVKELKVPKVGRVSRVTACLFGMLFVGVGVGIRPELSLFAPKVPVPALQVQQAPAAPREAAAPASTALAVVKEEPRQQTRVTTPETTQTVKASTSSRETSRDTNKKPLKKRAMDALRTLRGR